MVRCQRGKHYLPLSPVLVYIFGSRLSGSSGELEVTVQLIFLVLKLRKIPSCFTEILLKAANEAGSLKTR